MSITNTFRARVAETNRARGLPVMSWPTMPSEDGCGEAAYRFWRAIVALVVVAGVLTVAAFAFVLIARTLGSL